MPKIIEEPREAILSHAKSIVINHGYEQLTIRRVAKDAEISIGTVYNYFPTKRDLIIQLMEDYWNSYLSVVDDIDKAQADFFEKLLEIYKKLEIFVRTFQEVWIKNAGGNHSEEDLIKKKSFLDKLNKKLESILIEAQKNGSINVFTDSYTIAKFLILNFFMMALMNQFDYDSFEIIIRKLLR